MTPVQQITELVPPLHPGDRLKREEYERRYEAMPNLKKAELINGVVYMGSPVRFNQHAEPNSILITWLGNYRLQTPDVRLGNNGTIRFDEENEPQPDALLFLDTSRGGLAHIDADNYVNGPPELVVEISASTTPVDAGEKLHLYQRFGVKEYLIWRVEDQLFDWLVLKEGTYEPQIPDPQGILRSTVFPGLWLQVDALLRGNLAKVFQTLQRGLQSPEHQDFCTHQ